MKLKHNHLKEDLSMKLMYHRKGEYLFPNLAVQEAPVQLGKYGMLRSTFLKENRKNCTNVWAAEAVPGLGQGWTTVNKVNK